MALTITLSGKNLAFLPNGDVAVVVGNQQTVTGKWRTAAGTDPQDNQIRYTVSGASQPPLSAIYSFNSSNQLLATLKATDGTQSTQEPLLGSIEIDDAHRLVYHLIDQDGNVLDQAITLFGGNFHFAEGTGNLVMDLTGGGQVSIGGDAGINSLEAAENHVGGFQAADLLHFHASTDNTLGDGSVMTVPADLTFIGKWDIQKGSLKFLSKITGDLTKPSISIGFAGKFGAVSAGLVYFADAAGTQLAFNISGQHIWKAGNTTNEFNWQTSIGFSKTTFDAKVDFDFNSKNTNGRNFSVKGDLTLAQANGGPITIGFHLKAQYAWKNNILTFAADVSDVAGALSYQIMLEGNFKLGHGTIQFAIKLSNAAGANSLSLDLNFQGDKNSLIQVFKAQLHITETQAGIMINGTVELQLRFVKGVGVVKQITP